MESLARGDVRLNESEMEEVEKFFDMQRGTPIATAPMKCRGPACSIASRCPLHRMGKTAQMVANEEDCAIEWGMLITWIQELIEQMNLEDLDLSASTIALIKNQALMNLERWRIQAQLGADNLMLENIVGFTPQGDPMTNKVLNPLVRHVIDIDKRSQKLLSELMATPDAQDKAKRGSQDEVTITVQHMQKILEDHRTNEGFKEPDRNEIGVQKHQIDASDEYDMLVQDMYQNQPERIPEHGRVDDRDTPKHEARPVDDVPPPPTQEDPESSESDGGEDPPDHSGE